MNLKTIASMLAAVGLMTVSSAASAQSLTLRVEPGVSVPLTNPQVQRFDAGGSVAVKPELGIGSYLGVGPAVQFMVLPSRIDGIEAGTAWSYGAFARVKRPHDNAGTGWSAVSPWVDADAKYVRTDGLDRFGLAAAVGASVPTSSSRLLWIGPFARYDVVNNQDGKFGFNTNSAKVLTIGLSFEFGSPRKHHSEPAVAMVPDEDAPRVEPKAVKPETTTTVELLAFANVIQFAFNSAVLTPAAITDLELDLAAIQANKNCYVFISGHTSSEGQVAYNNKLSQRRADAVLNWFTTHGVSPDQLTAEGFGSTQPVDDNKTQAGRENNRRVEYVIILGAEETK